MGQKGLYVVGEGVEGGRLAAAMLLLPQHRGGVAAGVVRAAVGGVAAHWRRAVVLRLAAVPR